MLLVPDVRNRPGRTLILALLLTACWLMLIGCGVALTEGSRETEIFKKLTLSGSKTPSGQMLLELEYEQPYEVLIAVECDVLIAAKPTPTTKPTTDPLGTPTPTPVHIPPPLPTPRNRVSNILVEEIGPNANGGTVDEATPVVGLITRDFFAPEDEGDYLVRCYTPLDQSNQIIETFTVSEADES